MSLAIIGKKMGMSQLFDRKGQLVPVTVIQAGPCPVTQIKNEDSDSYSAVQIGFEDVGRKLLKKKAYSGHFKKAGVTPKKIVKEFRVDAVDDYKLGDEITVDRFKIRDRVDIVGISKGRGFAGVMKRHGFSGKDKAHGTHEAFRHGGSIGCRTPKRVIKAMKMPGRMGTERKTVKNLEIMYVDKENNLLLVKGPIPGWRNGYILVRKHN
jgi:large subunit ribosomal protein L3